MTMLAPNPNAAPQPTPVTVGGPNNNLNVNFAPGPTAPNLPPTGPNTLQVPITVVPTLEQSIENFRTSNESNTDLFERTQAAQQRYVDANIKYRFGKKARFGGEKAGLRNKAGTESARKKLDHAATEYAALRDQSVIEYFNANGITSPQEMSQQAALLAVADNVTIEGAIRDTVIARGEAATDKSDTIRAKFLKFWSEPQAHLFSKEGWSKQQLKNRMVRTGAVAAPAAAASVLLAPVLLAAGAGLGAGAAAAVGVNVLRGSIRGGVRSAIDNRARAAINGGAAYNPSIRETADQNMLNFDQQAMHGATNPGNIISSHAVIDSSETNARFDGIAMSAERAGYRKRMYKTIGFAALSSVAGVGVGTLVRGVINNGADFVGSILEKAPGGDKVAPLLGIHKQVPGSSFAEMSSDGTPIPSDPSISASHSEMPSTPSVPTPDELSEQGRQLRERALGNSGDSSWTDRIFGHSNSATGAADQLNGSGVPAPKTPEQLTAELADIKNDPAKLAAFQRMFQNGGKDFKLMDDTIQGRVNGIPKMTEAQSADVLKLAETQEAFKTMAHAPSDAMPNLVRTMEELKAANPNMTPAELATLTDNTLKLASLPGQQEAFKAMANNPDAFKAMDAAYKAGALKADSLADYNAGFDNNLRLAQAVAGLKQQGMSDDEISKLFKSYDLAA